MTTILAVTGVNKQGDTLTVSNDIEQGRATQNRLGRDFNGGRIHSIYAYNAEAGVYVYGQVSGTDWVLDFSNSPDTVTRSLGDAHLPNHSKDSLETMPESRDWGPAIDPLAQEIFDALKVTVKTETDKLREQVSEKDAMIALMMKTLDTLPPKQREAILAKLAEQAK